MGHGVDRNETADGSGAAVTPVTAGMFTAKGDLAVGTANAAVDNLAVGANETRLVADSTQATGLKYVADTTNYAIAAKGDLLAGTAADTVAPVTVGSDGTVLTADSSQSTGLAWGVQFSTGDVKLTLKTAADAGWVLMDDGTIGNASSSGTTRANADTEDLFTLLWTNTADAQCPVSSGRGASAAADFAANKTITLPRALGRALATYGSGSQSESGVNADVDTGADTLTVPSNNSRWFTGMQVTFTLTSGTITGLTSGNTYYVIRSSATLLKLASSLANAQNGTAIDFTAKSSPVWSISHSFTARVLAETAGEQSHAMSSTELLAHTHAQTIATANGSYAGSGGGNPSAGGEATGSRGGNAAMNIMQPTLFLNVMVKL